MFKGRSLFVITIFGLAACPCFAKDQNNNSLTTVLGPPFNALPYTIPFTAIPSLNINQSSHANFNLSPILPDDSKYKQMEGTPLITPIASHDNTKVITSTPTQVPTAEELLNQYYQLGSKGNVSNRTIILQHILLLYPYNQTAHEELGYLLIETKDPQAALQHFQTAAKIDPTNENNKLAIAYLYIQLGQQQTAMHLLESLTHSTQPSIREKSSQALKNLSNTTATPSHMAPPVLLQRSTTQPTPTSATHLDTFYQLKNRNNTQALRQLATITKQNPHDAQAQKEMGYLLLRLNRPNEALIHFQMAYNANPEDYETAAQMGYILKKLGRFKEAYDQFAIASHSSDPRIEQESQNELIYLAFAKYKIFSEPWFADLYFAPQYLSRFHDYIFPFDIRFGKVFGPQQRGEIYGILHGMDDTASQGGTTGNGGLSPIFADDAIILSAGARYYLVKEKFPLAIYSEGGVAYSLLNQPNQSDIRGDFRAGLIHGMIWGAHADYSSHFKFTFKPVGDSYANISYYTRYDDDLIGQLRIRQGFKILENHNSSMAIYLKAQQLFDTQQEYYNNLFEVGPGIALTPYNKINFIIRAERLYGYYINVDSPTHNPYGSHYNTDLILAEFYIRV